MYLYKNAFMETTASINELKLELIHWISKIKDKDLLKNLLKMRNSASKEFDFEKEWANAISGEEVKKRVKQHIDKLPWKE